MVHSSASYARPWRFAGALSAALAASALIGGSGALLAPTPAAAKTVDELEVYDDACQCDVVILYVGRAYPVDLEREARDILISDPNIVDVVLRTADQPVFFGQKIGQANILFFDENNRRIRSVEVRVEYDATMINQLIRSRFPHAQVHAESSFGELILSGTARSSAEVAAIQEMAERFMAAARASQQEGPQTPSVDPTATGVVNRIAVLNEEQIYLQVRVAEVARSALKELGIDWNAALQATNISSVISINDLAPNGLNGFLSASQSQLTFGPQTLSTFLKALEQYSLVATLAEPSLTAVSGESASFLAGGEFPVPTPDGEGGTAIEFKSFGVSLDFTPVVVGDGRISLQISTEVSQLTEAGAVVVDGFNIPALTVRRANTTLEIPSGGTIMMAGLIQSETRRLSAGLPGLRTVPVLGQFFRNENNQVNETELVVLVTPYSVRPGSIEDFVMPTDGFTPAGDLDVYLFGRLHAVYSGGTNADEVEYVREQVVAAEAPVGYIME